MTACNTCAHTYDALVHFSGTLATVLTREGRAREGTRENIYKQLPRTLSCNKEGAGVCVCVGGGGGGGKREQRTHAQQSLKS